MFLSKTALLFSALFLLLSCNYRSLLTKIKPEAKKTALVQQKEIPEEPGMKFIPGGTFKMGSTAKKSEHPIHRVRVDSFYLDEKEVTVYEYLRFCKATRRRMPKQPSWSDDDHPVVNITWKDARDFAAWSGKRLPTEAEWEYAARSNKPGTRYVFDPKNSYFGSFGNIADESLLQIKIRFPVKRRYDDGYIHTAPVGSFPANIFGLYDMEGNVLEWCSDWYAADYYKNSGQDNPRGPARGNYKIIRGASWNRSGGYLRATYRSWYPPACAFDFLGFRCAKDYRPAAQKKIAQR